MHSFRNYTSYSTHILLTDHTEGANSGWADQTILLCPQLYAQYSLHIKIKTVSTKLISFVVFNLQSSLHGADVSGVVVLQNFTHSLATTGIG